MTFWVVDEISYHPSLSLLGCESSLYPTYPCCIYCPATSHIVAVTVIRLTVSVLQFMQSLYDIYITVPPVSFTWLHFIMLAFVPYHITGRRMNRAHHFKRNCIHITFITEYCNCPVLLLFLIFYCASFIY